jgi:uncharacterized protein YgfB (UPF0149 family)
VNKFFTEVFPLRLPFILGLALFITVISYEHKVAMLKLKLSKAETAIATQKTLVLTWQNSALTAINKQQVKLVEAKKEAEKTIIMAETKITTLQQEYTVRESDDKSKAYEEIELLINSHFNL